MLVCVNLCKVTHSIEIEAKMLYRERLYDLRLLCVWGVRAAFERAPIPTLSLSLSLSLLHVLSLSLFLLLQSIGPQKVHVRLSVVM